MFYENIYRSAYRKLAVILKFTERQIKTMSWCVQTGERLDDDDDDDDDDQLL